MQLYEFISAGKVHVVIAVDMDSALALFSFVNGREPENIELITNRTLLIAGDALPGRTDVTGGSGPEFSYYLG